MHEKQKIGVDVAQDWIDTAEALQAWVVTLEYGGIFLAPATGFQGDQGGIVRRHLIDLQGCNDLAAVVPGE